MKLIFAVLYVSSTMGLTRCYKTEAFLHLYLQYFYNILCLSISDIVNYLRKAENYFRTKFR